MAVSDVNSNTGISGGGGAGSGVPQRSRGLELWSSSDMWGVNDDND